MSETTKPPEISAEVRHAMLALIYELNMFHPEIADGGHTEKCRPCRKAAEALKILAEPAGETH